MSRNYELLDTEAFKERLATKKGVDSAALVKGYVPTEVKQEGGKDSRRIRFTVSTQDVDRYGDTVNPKGWDLKSWKANPVVLFAHKSNELPVARGSNIRVEGGQYLRATAEFVEAEINPFAETIYQMISRGYLKATSVGFLPKKWKRPDEDEDKERHNNYGIDFEEQELLEFSIVPVPANPQCLVQAKSAGIDTAPIFDFLGEALDEWANYKGLLLVPREEVEVMRKTADDKQRTSLRVTKAQQERLLEENLKRIKEMGADDASEEVGQEEPVEAEVEAKDVAEVPSDESVVSEEVVEKSVEDELADEETTDEVMEDKDPLTVKLFDEIDDSAEYVPMLWVRDGSAPSLHITLKDTDGDDTETVINVLKSVLRSFGVADKPVVETAKQDDAEEVSAEEERSAPSDDGNDSVDTDEELDVAGNDALQKLIQVNQELARRFEELNNKINNMTNDELAIELAPEDEDEIPLDGVQDAVKELLPDIVKSVMEEQINKARGRLG